MGHWFFKADWSRPVGESVMAWNRPKPTEIEKSTKGKGAAKPLWVVGAGVLVLVIAAVLWFNLSSSDGEKMKPQVDGPSRIKTVKPAKAATNKTVRADADKKTVKVAQETQKAPRAGETNAVGKARQQIWGTESRREMARARGSRRIFKHQSEAYLSMYAEPGKPVPPTPFGKNLEEDILEALKEPIVINMNEDTQDEIDLKNIVQWMKGELQQYLDGGGTVQDYLKELAKRQDRECGMRSEAYKLVSDACKNDSAENAYELWKKTNQFLEEKGISPISKPSVLRREYGRGIDDFREPAVNPAASDKLKQIME